MVMGVLLVLLVLLVLPQQLHGPALSPRTAPHNCTCAEQRYCRPLDTPPPPVEVFPFTLGNLSTQYPFYRWDLVTTLSWGPTDELLCEAHRNGVRVVGSGGGVSAEILRNTSTRSQWATGVLADILAAGHDGVNFDIEGHPSMADEMTAALAELRTRARRQNPLMQISFCHVVFPADPNLRQGYDVASLIQRDLVDFILVMAYDMNWIRTECLENATSCWDPQQEPSVGNVPRPNAPLPGILAGIRQYESMGVPAAKLVVGLPWYGYTSECRTNSTTGSLCEMPCDGKNMSDCARVSKQIPFKEIAALLAAGASPTGVIYDAPSASVWADYIEPLSQRRHRVWFDTPGSLAIKMAALRQAVRAQRIHYTQLFDTNVWLAETDRLRTTITEFTSTDRLAVVKP